MSSNKGHYIWGHNEKRWGWIVWRKKCYKEVGPVILTTLHILNSQIASLANSTTTNWWDSTIKTTSACHSFGLSNTQLPKQLIFSQLTSFPTHNSSETNLQHEHPSVCPRINCRTGSPATNFGTAIDEHTGPHKVTRLSLHLKDTVSDSVFSYKIK